VNRQIENELKLSKRKVKKLQRKIRRMEKEQKQMLTLLGEKEKRQPMTSSGIVLHKNTSTYP